MQQFNCPFCGMRDQSEFTYGREVAPVPALDASDPEQVQPAVVEALRTGRVFVGFDMIADSSGFQWYASSAANRAVMGETALCAPDARLHATSPIPCRFTVIKDGTQVMQQEGRTLEWTPPGPGKYRVEAELKVLKEWVPWVYANPIELR